MRRINLLPGQTAIVRSHEEVWTILGSCVSFVLHSPARRISAINHAQFPAPGFSDRCPPSCPRSCGVRTGSDNRYVTCSFEFMLAELMKLNISPRELDIRLYGGAAVTTMRLGGNGVGCRNIAAAEQVVAAHQLSFCFKDVGGEKPRKLLHNSGTGETSLIQ